MLKANHCSFIWISGFLQICKISLSLCQLSHSSLTPNVYISWSKLSCSKFPLAHSYSYLYVLLQVVRKSAGVTYAWVVLCPVSYDIASENLMAMYNIYIYIYIYICKSPSVHIVLITAPELWAAVKTCRGGWGFVYLPSLYILFTSCFLSCICTPSCQALVLKQGKKCMKL